MFSEKEEKAFIVIDAYLSKLQASSGADWFNTYGKPSEFFLAKEIMDKHRLIIYRDPHSENSLSDISQLGLTVICKGGIKQYLLSQSQTIIEKETLERQQLRAAIENLTTQNQNYKKDRNRFIRNEWILWIGLALSIISLLLSMSSKK